MDIILRIKDIYNEAKVLSDAIDAVFEHEEHPVRVGELLGMKAHASSNFVALRDVLTSHESLDSDKLDVNLTELEARVRLYRSRWEKYRAGVVKRESDNTNRQDND